MEGGKEGKRAAWQPNMEKVSHAQNPLLMYMHVCVHFLSPFPPLV